MATTGERLRALRKRLGLTLPELESRSGVNRGLWSFVENDHRPLNRRMADRLEAVVGAAAMREVGLALTMRLDLGEAEPRADQQAQRAAMEFLRAAARRPQPPMPADVQVFELPDAGGYIILPVTK
jgi:transcriptional regulator with XRE-family HTH domain